MSFLSSNRMLTWISHHKLRTFSMLVIGIFFGLVLTLFLVPSVAVDVDTIAVSDIKKTYSTRGQMTSNPYFRASFPYEAICEQLCVKPFDDVKKGQILFSLQSDSFMAFYQVESRKYQFKVLNYKSQRNSLLINRKLYMQSVISEEDYNRSEESFFLFEQDNWARTQEEYKKLLALKNMMNCTAPFDGVISKVFADQGQHTAINFPIIELINTADIIVPIKVDKAFIDRIKVDQSVEIFKEEHNSQGEAQYSKLCNGRVKSINPQVVEDKFDVTVHLDDLPLEKFDVGATLKINIITLQRLKRRSVSNLALRYRNNETYVYVVDKYNRARERKVSIGLIGDTRSELLKGAALNERVIIYPFTVKEYQRVNVTNHDN